MLEWDNSGKRVESQNVSGWDGECIPQYAEVADVSTVPHPVTSQGAPFRGVMLCGAAGDTEELTTDVQTCATQQTPDCTDPNDPTAGVCCSLGCVQSALEQSETGITS